MTEAQQFIALEQDEDEDENVKDDSTITFQDDRQYREWLSKNNLNPYKYN